MKNIMILLNEISNLIQSQGETLNINNKQSQIFKMLSFFFKKGNNGVNALREIIEQANDDSVDVEWENDEMQNTYSWHIALCYDLHDIEIIEHRDIQNPSKNFYEIIDKSRKEIDSIKKEFTNLDFAS